MNNKSYKDPQGLNIFRRNENQPFPKKEHDNLDKLLDNKFISKEVNKPKIHQKDGTVVSIESFFNNSYSYNEYEIGNQTSNGSVNIEKLPKKVPEVLNTFWELESPSKEVEQPKRQEENIRTASQVQPFFNIFDKNEASHTIFPMEGTVPSFTDEIDISFNQIQKVLLKNKSSRVRLENSNEKLKVESISEFQTTAPNQIKHIDYDEIINEKPIKGVFNYNPSFIQETGFEREFVTEINVQATTFLHNDENVGNSISPIKNPQVKLETNTRRSMIAGPIVENERDVVLSRKAAIECSMHSTSSVAYSPDDFSKSTHIGVPISKLLQMLRK